MTEQLVLPAPASSPPPPGRSGSSHRVAGHLACERCRNRKIKCSGMPGPCRNCTQHGYECVLPKDKKEREQQQLLLRIEQLEKLTASQSPDGATSSAGPPPPPLPLSQQVGGSKSPGDMLAGIFPWDTPHLPWLPSQGEIPAATESAVFTGSSSVSAQQAGLAAGTAVTAMGQSPWWPVLGFSPREMDGPQGAEGGGDPGELGLPASQSLYLPSEIGRLPETVQPISSPSTSIDSFVNSAGVVFYLGVLAEHPDHPMSSLPVPRHWIGSPNMADIYTRLFAAAIGALHHHKSRQKSSTYVIMAESLPIPDLWDDIDGLECALWNACYRFHEETSTFIDEADVPMSSAIRRSSERHPPNLWLRMSRIIARCIDLGLTNGYLAGHEPLQLSPQSQDQPDPRSKRYSDCLRAAYRLDTRISTAKQRPRVIRAADLDPALLALLQ